MYAPDGHEYYDDLVSDDPRDGVGISLGQRVALAGNSICVGVLAEVLRGVFAPSSPTLDRWTEELQGKTRKERKEMDSKMTDPRYILKRVKGDLREMSS